MLQNLNVHQIISWPAFTWAQFIELTKLVLWPQSIHPLRVILVRGSQTDLQVLSDNIRTMTRAKLFTPKLGQVVNASMESHIYQVSDMFIISWDL